MHRFYDIRAPRKWFDGQNHDWYRRCNLIYDSCLNRNNLSSLLNVVLRGKVDGHLSPSFCVYAFQATFEPLDPQKEKEKKMRQIIVPVL